MTLRVIGAGLGRTGTLSLWTAINQLGLGPCHHMDEVIQNMEAQVPLWQAAVEGRADWAAIYKGYNSALDWPSVAFYRELNVAFPTAKFILSVRSPESWVASFSETIYKLLYDDAGAPGLPQSWTDMVVAVVRKSGFTSGLTEKELMRLFLEHSEAVKNTIPAERLLVFDVKQGWEPLCTFLGTPIPDEPFPRTNNRAEFWKSVESPA